MGGIDRHGDRALVSDGELEGLEIPTGHIDVVLQRYNRSYGLVTHTILKKKLVGQCTETMQTNKSNQNKRLTGLNGHLSAHVSPKELEILSISRAKLKNMYPYFNTLYQLT